MLDSTYAPVKSHDVGDNENKMSEIPEISIDDLLDKLEGGPFNWLLLILCGLSFMADAMVIL